MQCLFFGFIFWKKYFADMEQLKQVVTDNGPEIEGAFRELLERYRIPQTKISPTTNS